MSLTEKPKFLTAIIIALLLLNFGTLTFMWTHQHGGPPPPGIGGGPDRNRVFNFLVDELKLTDEQKKQYEELRNEHHSQVVTKQETGRKLHDSFFEQLTKADADSVTINSLADSIAANQKQVDLITLYHFKKVRAICTPQQQKRFDEIIAEAIRMMSPHPPGPGR